MAVKYIWTFCHHNIHIGGGQARSMLDYITTAAAIKSYQLIARYPHLAPDREDIQQDIIIRARDRWPHYDPSKSSPRTFISRVIANIAASIARRAEPRRVFISTPVQKKGVGWLFAIHEVIDALPDKTRLVARLTMEGYTRRDVCKIAGVSLADIYRVHLPAMRAALRDFRNGRE